MAADDVPGKQKRQKALENELRTSATTVKSARLLVQFATDDRRVVAGLKCRGIDSAEFWIDFDFGGQTIAESHVE